MKLRKALIGALLIFLSVTPAKADNRIIVRSTLGLQGLQQLLNVQLLCGVPLLQQACSVTGLGDPLNQVFLVTTPLDGSTVTGILRLLPGIVDAELDQLLSLLGGLNRAPSPPPTGLMSDRSPVLYFGTTVWNSYANQPAAQIVRVATAQNQFQVAGAGIIADIDTGVDPNHPVLAGVLLPGYDFTRNQSGGSELTDFTDPTPQACPSCPPANVNQSSVAILDQSSVAILDTKGSYAAFGHGTMVMGIIHLVAPKAKLLPVKAFHSDGTGYLSDIIHSIYYAAQNHANVINMSFDFTTYSQEFASALLYANQSALICGTSAGNDGQKEIVYPAALQSVAMGVASTSDTDTRSSFSNYGDAIVWVAAPGEGIVTTYPFGTYAAGWGTSFSAPFVAGTSGLLLNKQANTNESQAAAAVAHAVAIGSDMGNGRLDIVQALQTLSPADFSLSAAPTIQTINAGQTAIYTATVTPSNGFNQAVTLTCSGFPPASICIVNPQVVTPNGTTPSPATVTVQTTLRGDLIPAAPKRVDPLPWDVLARLIWIVAWVIWLLFWSTRISHKRNSFGRPDMGVAIGLLAVSLCLYSCVGVVPGPPTSAKLSSVTLNPASVSGGSSSTGTVTLSAQAPSGGALVSLSSANTAVATVPVSVTIPAGTTSATFTVVTLALTASASVTISASYAGVTQTAPLSVTPQSGTATLASVTLNPASVSGGSSSTGTVTLSAQAPSGGALVSLSSANTAVATVPASVTIPAGITSATFTVVTLAVTASASVTISASYAGVTQTAPLTVTPQSATATLASLRLNPTSVNGGSPSTGTVALSAPALSGGTLVTLSSSNTSVATVPASVTIPAGSTSAVFTVTTLIVNSSTTVTISAIYAGVTQTAVLTVTPQAQAGPTLTSLTLHPTSIQGGSTSMGSVALSAPALTGGALITLTSSKTSVATVPASVTIPAGATSATFMVNTLAVTASTTVTISASYAGVTHTASLTVTPTPPPGTPAGTYKLTITGTSGNLSHNTTVTLVVN